MEGYLFSFEKLEVWKASRTIAGVIYRLVKKFPEEEKFGLAIQMRRAVVSVCANIAEGSTRSSSKDQAHFTTIAYGSLIELLNHLLISRELGYICDEDVDLIRPLVQDLSVRLSNLRKTQLAGKSTNPGLKTYQ
ncbi:MAG TPA: four helix bundle protein [Flavisolibacter sp.]